MTVSIPSDCRKFRAAVVPLFAFVLAGTIVVLWCLILATDGWHFDRHAAAFASGFEAVFSLGASWMLSLLFPDGFSEKGIYGHSFWGRRRFVGWQDVAAARTLRLFNLRFLRVYATDGKVTWLALFQSQGAEFRQEIRRLAPPESLVLKCL
jgi:hypothetical protein